MNVYQIAFDPGLSATGWALFDVNGIDSTGTIRPKGSNRSDKLFYLHKELNLLFSNWVDRFGGLAKTAAIEEWGKFSQISRFQTMIACAEARGILMAICFQYAKEVKYVTKGKAPKAEADWLAAKFGIKGSEHARDAAHLGMIAGFFR